MADETIESKEEKKRPRGRPKKVDKAAEELVNEGKEELKMVAEDKSATAKPTMSSVKQSLTALYQRARGGNWIDRVDTLSSYNPFLQNQRLKMISTLPGEMTDDEIAEALNAPQAYEQPLRGAGWDFSNKQYLYYQILRLAADVPLYNYYKTPALYEKDIYNSSSFAEEDRYVDEWLDTFNPKTTLKRVALETKREGKSTYLFRNSVYRDEKGEHHVNYTTWQKMPSNYIKLTAIGEHGYIASFDMMLFMNIAFNVSQYPPFIREIWEDLTVASDIIHINPYGKYEVDVARLANFEYRNAEGKLTKGIFEARESRYLYWVQLPQDICFTFASDSSHPWAVPDTVGLFQALRELSDYATLASLIASTPLTAILTGEIETIDDPNPGQDQTVMNPQTIAGFQNDFNAMTSTNVEALFVPVKNLKLQSIPDQVSSSDIVTSATQNFIAQAGEGGVLVATENPSVAQVKGAQLLEASKHDFVTRQFEDILNMLVNEHIGCQYTWKIHLWGDIYSVADEVGRLKEMWQGGATFLLPRLASAYHMTVRDTKATSMYIDSLDVYSNFKTLTQETQQKEKEKLAKMGATRVSTGSSSTDDQAKRSVGRPEMSDSEVTSDATAASKDSGLNKGEMRYSYSGGKCVVCGADTEEGQIMCEFCKETFLKEKGEL